MVDFSIQQKFIYQNSLFVESSGTLYLTSAKSMIYMNKIKFRGENWILNVRKKYIQNPSLHRSWSFFKPYIWGSQSKTKENKRTFWWIHWYAKTTL